MAIVARSQENRRLTPATPVPIGSTEGARMQGEAVQAFGEGVQRFGNSFEDYQNKVQAQEDAVNTQYVNNQLQNLHKTTLDKARDTSSLDGSNMADIYNSDYDKESAKIINSISSEKVRTNAQNFNRLLVDDAQAQLKVDSLAKKQNYVYDVMGKNANLVADRIRQNPNENLLAAEFSSFNKQFDDDAFSVLTPEQKIKLKDGAQKIFAQSIVEGYAAKEQYGRALQFLTATQKTPDVYTEIPPNQAAELGLINRDEAGVLSGKGENYKVPTMSTKGGTALSPQVAVIANSLGASEKSHLIDQMKAKLNERTAMRLSDLNAQMNGLEKLGLSGQTIDPTGVAMIKNEINQNPNLTEQARVRLFDRVNSIMSANKTLQTVKNLPRNQWESAIQQLDTKTKLSNEDASLTDPRMKSASTDFATLAQREAHKEVVMRQLSEIRKEQDKDAAQFVQSDPTIGLLRAATKDGNPAAMDKYIQASLAKQDYLGIPKENQRILTKSEAQQHASFLQALPQGKDAGAYMDQLQQQYGPNFPKVFSEIVGQEKDLSSMQIASYMEDPTAKGKVFDNIRNRKAILEGMKSSDTMQTYGKLADMQVSEAMEDFRGILASSGDKGIGIANGFQEQLQLEVKKRIQKDPSGKPDVEKITSEAYKDLVSSTYSVVTSTSSKVLIPNAIDGKSVKTENVKAFLDVYGKGSFNQFDSFKDLEVGVPASYQKSFGEEAKTKWYQELRRSSKWISNNDQSGLRLVYPTQGGTLVPVLDNNGKPVERSLLDISFKPTKRMLDKQKGFLGSLFE